MTMSAAPVAPGSTKLTGFVKSSGENNRERSDVVTNCVGDIVRMEHNAQRKSNEPHSKFAEIQQVARRPRAKPHQRGFPTFSGRILMFLLSPQGRYTYSRAVSCEFLPTEGTRPGVVIACNCPRCSSLLQTDDIFTSSARHAIKRGSYLEKRLHRLKYRPIPFHGVITVPWLQ